MTHTKRRLFFLCILLRKKINCLQAVYHAHVFCQKLTRLQVIPEVLNDALEREYLQCVFPRMKLEESRAYLSNFSKFLKHKVNGFWVFFNWTAEGGGV